MLQFAYAFIGPGTHRLFLPCDSCESTALSTTQYASSAPSSSGSKPDLGTAVLSVKPGKHGSGSTLQIRKLSPRGRIC